MQIIKKRKLWDEAFTASVENAKTATAENAQKNTAPKDDVQYAFRGVNKDGIEAYESPPKVRSLSPSDKRKAYVTMMKKAYFGRTARFERNGHFYYATFDQKNIRKAIYGDN